MLINVTMPQLGESVSEGTISKWLVREGDVVQKDQPLVAIGTDKADSELPAPASGRVSKILAQEGEVLAVKALLCQIEEGQTNQARPNSSDSSPRNGTSPAPSSADESRSSRSATGGSMATPTARKAALENEINLDDIRGSGERGRITRDDVMRAKEGTSIPKVDGGERFQTQATDNARVPDEAAGHDARTSEGGATLQAPTASLARVVNQGGGFVPPIPGTGFGAFKVPPYRPKDGDKVIPFSRRRRITADHMTYSKFASPHVVTVAEVDLHKASLARETHKERYKKEGLSLTMLAFVVVAAARAVSENKGLNARVLDDAYVIFQDINIGVAVDSPDGLVVPVVRRANELGVRGIVRAIDDVAKRARTGKITADDLSGATFSITNPGIKGNLFGGAIINQPNVGILRMGEIQKRVVVVEGENKEDLIAIHPVMYIALSYDHRIVDGVLANSFLWRVTELLEKADFEI